MERLQDIYSNTEFFTCGWHTTFIAFILNNETALQVASEHRSEVLPFLREYPRSFSWTLSSSTLTVSESVYQTVCRQPTVLLLGGFGHQLL